MKQKRINILFHFALSLTLFSLWAGFALLVVNKLFYKDLPGYTIGKICIWELVALTMAVLIGKVILNKWGTPQFRQIDEKHYLVLNPKYAYYFGIYFLVAMAVGIWQFWVFSQSFN